MAKTPLLSLPPQIRAQIELERRRRQREAGEGLVNIVHAETINYERYQQDPAGFGREVLGEHYTDDVITVMESVRDNPVTIARSANAVGKSHGAARIAVWFYKCFPGAQVYTTAAPPESNLRKILWGEIGSILQKHSRLFVGDHTNTLNISRSPQEFITGVAIPMAGTPEQRQAKFSGKHAPNMLFIVDEGDAVPIEVYKGIEACMSGGNAHLLIMFNPRGASGPVYMMERDRRANVVQLTAFNHPNVLTGEDQIPGAVSREKTVRRLNDWSRPLVEGENPDIECFQVPECLVGSTARSLDGTAYPPLPPGWRKMTNPSLAYMVMGIYPPQSETQLISRAWIEAANVRWQTYVATYGEIPPSMRPRMGLDVAEFGPDKNVACLRWGGFVGRFIHFWQGVDPDMSAIKASEIYKVNNVRWAAVDATGVGSGVAPRMMRLECELVDGIKVASSPTYATEMGEFNSMRDQLWWSVREWLRTDPGAMLPPDDALSEELTVPTYAIMNGRIKVTDKDTMKEMLGRSPDFADALCLTFAPDEEATGQYGNFEYSGYRG